MRTPHLRIKIIFVLSVKHFSECYITTRLVLKTLSISNLDAFTDGSQQSMIKSNLGSLFIYFMLLMLYL